MHDGPGIRTTLFFKGCPLECAWCHNPESISPQPELMLRGDRCLACGACIAACQQEAIMTATGGPATRREHCRACGRCADACPAEARAIIGREITIASAMTALLADRIFYDQSGGGVTFSGGEPLRQHEFLHTLLEQCRRQALHTAVDTCGYAPWPIFERIAPLTDLFLFDIKMIDAEKHRRWTGVSNRLILENLARLDLEDRPIHLRLPIIPGINDSPADIDKMAEWLDTLHHVQALHLLPFHRGGTEKYQRLGRTFHLHQTAPPETAQIDSLAERLRNHIENSIDRRLKATP